MVQECRSLHIRLSGVIVVELAFQSLLLLFLAAFIAGFIDSIAGGGGLITLPAMLIAGIPPLQTLGTNKLQSMFGAGSATIAYARKGHVDLRSQLPMAALAGLGGALGAILATIVPGDVLRALMPFLLVAIAAYFALKPNLSDVDRHQRMTPFLFGVTFVPLIGFYDGVFGPGTGSFFMLAFVSLAGFGMLKATAHTKLLNLSSNVGAFLVFLVNGVVLWKVGLLMGLGQFLGAQAGSRLAMRNGARLIKPLLIVTCVALAVKLLMDPANPVRVWAGI
ncbi:TSUP family transporter [Rhizobium sp. CAU 1783]